MTLKNKIGSNFALKMSPISIILKQLSDNPPIHPPRHLNGDAVLPIGRPRIEFDVYLESLKGEIKGQYNPLVLSSGYLII